MIGPNPPVFSCTALCFMVLPPSAAHGIACYFCSELYLNQGLPKFPNSTVYAEAMVPVVACARKLMPNASIGACGAAGTWNEGLRPYFQRSPPLFDGLSHHNYSPSTHSVTSLPAQDQMSYIAGYSRAGMSCLSCQVMHDSVCVVRVCKYVHICIL